MQPKTNPKVAATVPCPMRRYLAAGVTERP